MNKTVIVAAGVVIVVSILLVSFITGQDEQPVTVPVASKPAPAPVPAPPLVLDTKAPVEAVENVSPPEPVTEQPPTPEPEQPKIPVAESLSRSDMIATVALQTLSPQLAKWVIPEEQVRKFVLVVDQLASGKMPQRHIPLDYSMAPFKVEGGGETLRIDALNEQRMNQLVDTVTAMDPKQAGQYYQAWLPVLEQAYGELGKRDTFRERVTALVNKIQAIEEAPEGATLVRPSVLYQYSDPQLEGRSDLEKWFWRMGDDNRAKVQAFLREVKFYL